MKNVTKWKVYDWAGNDVGSPEFDYFDDASDWISETIDKVYGLNLTDDEYDQQRDEYQITDVTSDEDRHETAS